MNRHNSRHGSPYRRIKLARWINTQTRDNGQLQNRDNKRAVNKKSSRFPDKSCDDEPAACRPHDHRARSVKQKWTGTALVRSRALHRHIQSENLTVLHFSAHMRGTTYGEVEVELHILTSALNG